MIKTAVFMLLTLSLSLTAAQATPQAKPAAPQATAAAAPQAKAVAPQAKAVAPQATDKHPAVSIPIWPVEVVASQVTKSDDDLPKVTDMVFKTSLFYGIATPPGVRSMFESKFTNAEKRFRGGKSPGISVEQLVDFYNKAAAQIGVQSRTSVNDMTVLRWQLSAKEPHFLSEKGNLSPLQALHLLSLAIFQRLDLPDGDPYSKTIHERVTLQEAIRSGFQNLKTMDGFTLLGEASDLFLENKGGN